MKACVFIIGTNGVGKSTLAKAIIELCGGIDNDKTTKEITYCNNGKVSLAGNYHKKFCGLDSLGQTKILATLCEQALAKSDVFISEGCRMNTLGMSMTNAMFKADAYLVVSLYTDMLTIYNRLQERTGSEKKRDYKQIQALQRQSMKVAKKWQSIGVHVVQLNSSGHTPTEEAGMVLNELNKLGVVI